MAGSARCIEVRDRVVNGPAISGRCNLTMRTRRPRCARRAPLDVMVDEARRRRGESGPAAVLERGAGHTAAGWWRTEVAVLTKSREIKPLPTVWRVPDDLWELIRPILAAGDPPSHLGRRRAHPRPIPDAVIFPL